MEWKKKGLIIKPFESKWWMQSHAMIPTIDYLKDNLYNIYFSGRDKHNRSHIGYAIIKINNSTIKFEKYADSPILSPGERGTFDDNGVTPSCIIDNGNEKRLYYIGWNSGTMTTRMSLIAGLSLSKDGGRTFKRYSRGPLLERTNREPFSILTAPFVIFDDNKWKMWYVSGEGWINKDLPKYNIKYAESNDGIQWKRDGHVCIDFKDVNETALARPCILKENGIFKMWYSYKNPDIGYRIGYAESQNGFDWKRMDDKAGIDVSKNGWDSEMIEYSYIIKHKGLYYMFYNGNGYGENGIGYAVLEQN